MKAAERAAWSKDVDVYFDDKAWFTDQAAMSWVEGSLKPFAAALREEAKAAGHTVPRDLLLTCDNLAAHTKPAFKAAVSRCGALCWYLAKGCTDILQAIDAGT